MKYVLQVMLLVLSIMMVTSNAQQYPKPVGYVSDFARLLTQEQSKALNDDLIAFEKSNTIEIAVVTVPWLNNKSIEDYTRDLANEWGVGKRGQSNGIVFLIAPKERKMRIGIAEGARKTLTDSQADTIRDTAVLPRFKAGNMQQGIIDGTHAIMRVFDTNTVHVAPVKEIPQESSVVGPTEKSGGFPNNLKTLVIFFGIAIIVILVGLYIAYSVASAVDRRNFFEEIERLKKKFPMVEKAIKNSDVNEETRKMFAKLKASFSTFDCLKVTSKTVYDSKLHSKLLSLHLGESLDDITCRVKNQIAFAEKARREGPELLKNLPKMIKDTEKKIADGKSSSKATTYLEEARKQYVQAETQYSGMTMTDWLILYMILDNAQSNVMRAESVHDTANRSWSQRPADDDTTYDHSSTSSNDSSSSGDFGSSSGFDGGGGFDSGGSSGSW